MAFMSISAYPCIDCCSCFWPHPQKTFCNSDVVMHAEFLGATFTDATDEFYGDYQVITYEIEIVQVGMKYLMRKLLRVSKLQRYISGRSGLVY
ncbi:hypothetical protein NDU88_000972 [Pleurodeles waltl]|uniref:Uncharacterized protein n=1 Tax=Pleurodeles waltl TaxID=8319 RepID=A0AAV7LZQ0_PLEWA|nr:hypothetical protein NDU88_000972 [Pleurodeles waltl]